MNGEVRGQLPEEPSKVTAGSTWSENGLTEESDDDEVDVSTISQYDPTQEPIFPSELQVGP